MVERIQKLLGETSLGNTDVEAEVSGENDVIEESKLFTVGDNELQLHQRSHHSFLEDLAKQECIMFSCKEHQTSVHRAIDNVDDLGENGGDNDENEGDRWAEERRRFHLLQWSSDDDDDFDSEDYSADTYDNADIGAFDEFHDGERPEDSDDGGFDSHSDAESSFNEQGDVNPIESIIEDRNPEELLHQEPFSQHDNKSLISLLIALTNSWDEPLIRADIDWDGIISCADLTVVYPASELQDNTGTKLLQGTIRMDPPLEVVEKILDSYPMSCLDMNGFFAACQFADPKTSQRASSISRNNQSKRHKSSLSNWGRMIECEITNKDDVSDTDDSDVGEVVKLVMHRTIRARQSSNITWGMVAFLGDARTTPSHTKQLLLDNPEVLIDTRHGEFGVSPLDRMVSGNFIHGDTQEWAEKLRLALRATSFVRLTREQLSRKHQKAIDVNQSHDSQEIVLPKNFFSSKSTFLRMVNSFLPLSDGRVEAKVSSTPCDPLRKSFYPYHELIRILVSPSFGGTKFGDAGFLNTLEACTNSDPNAFLRPDNLGNLPVHVALSSLCNTALGVKGERSLIRYLLGLHKKSSLCPENNGTGRLPLRMSIQNAWPVYDIIIAAALSCDSDAENDANRFLDTNQGVNNDATVPFRNHINSVMIRSIPLLHDALNGPYHPKFGIHGARQLVKNIIAKVSQSHNTESSLSDLVDGHGRTALHIAIAYKWPVHDIIVHANPILLEAPDPCHHGLYPFQLVASMISRKLTYCDGIASIAIESDFEQKLKSNEDSELVEVSVLWEMIRADPLCVTWDDSDKKLLSINSLALSTSNQIDPLIDLCQKKRRRSSYFGSYCP